MNRALLSPLAQGDLVGIWDYTVANWGKTQAERYTRLLESAVAEIVIPPKIGRPRDEIRPGYRKYSVGTHIVFYRRAGSDIDIVRILHQNMDVDRHL